MEENLKTFIMRCHRYGDFTLSGGGKDVEYYDLALLFLDSKGLGFVTDAIIQEIVVLEFDTIACLEMCPAPLVGSILLRFRDHDRCGAIVRKQRKGHGTNRLVEGYALCGNKVVLIEDVTSTGESAKKAIDALEAEGCEVVMVMTIINRQEGCDKLLQGYDFRWLFTKDELLSE